jgi:hypothetical protein
MNAYLLDVNSVLAMLDPMHLHHDAVHRWYAKRKKPRLVLCSHVINGGSELQASRATLIR